MNAWHQAVAAEMEDWLSTKGMEWCKQKRQFVLILGIALGEGKGRQWWQKWADLCVCGVEAGGRQG
jgi:hypothetical protein